MVGMSKAKPDPKSFPKRFYAQVSVQQHVAAFSVLLDGKPIRTPAKKLLSVASQQLAENIAAEWHAQKEFINTDSMPLMRLASIALDRIAQDRAELLADTANYAETDLLCYRSDDAVLQQKQVQHFDPILDWLAAEFSAPLYITNSVMPVQQKAASLDAIAAAFSAANDGELTGLAMLVPILGSAVLTLAVWKRRITINEALTLARLDETHQAQQWGADHESAEAWANKCRDARAAAFFLDMQVTQNAV